MNGVLEQLKESDDQFDLSGMHNIWIVKPAGKSRGRGALHFNRFDCFRFIFGICLCADSDNIGICLFQDLEKMLEHAAKNEGEWVAQKYIENPQIVLGRKFDIRLWCVACYCHSFLLSSSDLYAETSFFNCCCG